MLRHLFIVSLLLAAPALGGDIAGTVTFQGTPPPPLRLQTGGDPRCSTTHKGPLFSEDVVVNANGTLRNVVVAIKSGLPARQFGTPQGRILLSQEGCRYVPHVVAMMAGQEVEIVNGDLTLHNIHALSSSNPPFNVAQPKQGMRTTKRFDSPEIFKVKCEVHPWMNAFVAVFPHPFFSVTGGDGSFVLHNVPPGDYTIDAWHERYGVRTVKVRVESASATRADFSYSIR